MSLDTMMCIGGYISALGYKCLATVVFFVVPRVDLALCTIGIYHLAISASLKCHHLQKAEKHPTISKLMCRFFFKFFAASLYT